MKHLNEFFFWSHLAFIPAAVSTGIFLPPVVAISLVVLHRLHTFVFDGCAFSAVQKTAGGMPKNVDFLQYATKRLIGIKLSNTQSRVLDYSLASVTVMLVVVKILG